jgi:hypothetical protein
MAFRVLHKTTTDKKGCSYKKLFPSKGGYPMLGYSLASELNLNFELNEGFPDSSLADLQHRFCAAVFDAQL